MERFHRCIFTPARLFLNLGISGHVDMLSSLSQKVGKMIRIRETSHILTVLFSFSLSISKTASWYGDRSTCAHNAIRLTTLLVVFPQGGLLWGSQPRLRKNMFMETFSLPPLKTTAQRTTIMDQANRANFLTESGELPSTTNRTCDSYQERAESGDLAVCR